MRSSLRRLLLVVVVLAAVLRFTGIEAKLFWGDEIFSLTFANGKLRQHGMAGMGSVQKTSFYRDLMTLEPTYYSQRLLSVLRYEVHPPVYYFVLNLWIHVFGTSEASLRSLSVLFSVASIPLLYLLGSKLFSARTGLLAALIFSLAPFQIAYAQEARSYTLMLFLSILSTLLAVRLCEAKGSGEWRWLSSYAAAALMGFFTHYFFFWNILFQWVIVTWHQRRNRPFLLNWGLSQALVVGLFSLWLPAMRAQIAWARGEGAYHIHTAGGLSLPELLYQTIHSMIIFLSVRRVEGFCQYIFSSATCGVDRFLTLLFASLALLVLSVCAYQCIRQLWKREERRRGIWLCLLWVFFVFAGTLAGDIFFSQHMVKFPKYMISASAPLYLLVAASLTFGFGKRAQKALSIFVISFLIVGAVLYLSGLTKSKFILDFRAAAAHLDREAAPGDLILVWGSEDNLLALAYYLKSDAYLAGMQRTEDMPSHLKTFEIARGRIWFLGLDTSPSLQPQGYKLSLGWFLSRFKKINTKRFDQLALILFSRSQRVDNSSSSLRP